MLETSLHTSIRKYSAWPTISIIIPTYNYAHFLPTAIDSALNQLGVEVEVIVIDDGSTDGTAELVLQRYKGRVKLIRQDNAGLSAARNTGIAHATGEYVQLLDADDLLSMNTCVDQLRFLSRRSGHLAVCRSRLFEHLDTADRPRPTGNWRLFETDLDVHLCFRNIAPPHAFLMHRRVVDKVGKFDPGLRACEDYDYWLRASVAGYVPQANPGAEVFYRKHSGSMSANRENQVDHDRLLVLRLRQLLEQYPTFPLHARVSGLVFAASGAVLVSRDLRELGSAHSREMLGVAAEWLTELLRNKGSLSRDNHELVRLALWRMRCDLARPSLRAEGSSLRQLLSDVSGQLDGEFSAGSVIRALTRQLLRRERARSEERKEAFRLLLSWARNAVAM